MKIDELVTSENIEEVISEHIITDYVPYTTKVSDCERIITSSSYVTVNGKKMFKASTASRFMLFVITLIQRYTDFELSDDLVKDFETLDKYEFVETIVAHIPEKEYESYSTLLDFAVADVYDNDRDIVSFLETKVEALNTSLLTLLEVVQENFIAEE